MEKAKKRNIAINLLKGRLKCAEFALTNACASKCTFCNIWKQSPKVFVGREQGLKAIDRLAEFGVSHITLTGGEPLLNPHIAEFAARATKNRMNSAVLDAAPQLLLRNGMIGRLEDAGTDMISISFDSADPDVMAQSRQIDGIMDGIAEAVAQIKRTAMKSMASVLIWNGNHDKLDEVCAKAQELGFDIISLNYPTFSKSNVYELGGDGIAMPRESIVSALEEAIRLKESKKYHIINSVMSMRNIIDFLTDPATVKYQCLGGKRVLFVDWFLNVHPCMQLATSLGNILTMDEKDLDIESCNACNMSWYRDFSMLFNGWRSIPALIESATSMGWL
ncbi:MAG: radical SAM protein [Clostridiales bacterium]|jgi:MoaA/NifB/PqqE/SkfB family radical SAM enzyme|nr:radical SAM protein [Clostridiales bacterium]